jgi:hypothetical protein
MFSIGPAAEIVDEDEKTVNESDQIDAIKENNVNEAAGHNLLTHRTSVFNNNDLGNKHLSAVNNLPAPPQKRILNSKPALKPMISIGQISVNSTQSVLSRTESAMHLNVHQTEGRWIDDHAAW